MKNSGDSTHRPRAIDPARFRNVATGIGVSQSASAMTGAARSYEVVEHMPPDCRRCVPRAEGYKMDVPYEGQAETDGMESGFGEGVLY